MRSRTNCIESRYILLIQHHHTIGGRSKIQTLLIMSKLPSALLDWLQPETGSLLFKVGNNAGMIDILTVGWYIDDKLTWHYDIVLPAWALLAIMPTHPITQVVVKAGVLLNSLSYVLLLPGLFIKVRPNVVMSQSHCWCELETLCNMLMTRQRNQPARYCRHTMESFSRNGHIAWSIKCV